MTDIQVKEKIGGAEQHYYPYPSAQDIANLNEAMMDYVQNKNANALQVVMKFTTAYFSHPNNPNCESCVLGALELAKQSLTIKGFKI